ncbi:hypothetical protein GCM10023222_58380 [Saccharopolyspora cebuensis]
MTKPGGSCIVCGVVNNFRVRKYAEGLREHSGPPGLPPQRPALVLTTSNDGELQQLTHELDHSGQQRDPRYCEPGPPRTGLVAAACRRHDNTYLSSKDRRMRAMRRTPEESSARRSLFHMPLQLRIRVRARHVRHIARRVAGVPRCVRAARAGGAS